MEEENRNEAVARLRGTAEHDLCVCAECCAAAMMTDPAPSDAIWRGWESGDGVLGWDETHILVVYGSTSDRGAQYVLCRRRGNDIDGDVKEASGYDGEPW